MLLMSLMETKGKLNEAKKNGNFKPFESFLFQPNIAPAVSSIDLCLDIALKTCEETI